MSQLTQEEEEQEEESNVYTIDSFPPKNGIRVVSWNVRSLRGKFKEVTETIHELQADVVCLQEVWGLPSNFCALIPGFHPPICCLRTNMGGGGVMTYVKNTIPVEEKKSIFKVRHLESQMLEITIKKTTYTLLNCYFGQTEKTNIIKSLKTQLSKIPKKANLIVLGDFNIDLKKISIDTEADYLLETLQARDLFPRAFFITRSQGFMGQQQKSCIDNIFTNIRIEGRCFGLSDSLSDHLPLILEWGGETIKN